MSTRKASSRHWSYAWKKATFVPCSQVWKHAPAAASSIRMAKRERQAKDEVDAGVSRVGNFGRSAGQTAFGGVARRKLPQAVAADPPRLCRPADGRRNRGADARHPAQQP